MRRFRLVWWLLPVALLVGGADGPGYRGCAGAEGPEEGGTPLPTADVECTSDDDCAMDDCALYRCVANACVEVAPLLDRDGDGVAPPPCGGDCDDANPDRAPGIPELCDSIDNDCNDIVDDGAPRLDAVYSLSAAGGTTSQVVGWGEQFLVTEATRGALWGVPQTVGGDSGTPFELMRLAGGSRFTAVAVGAANDGRVLAVTATDLGTTRYVIYDPVTGAALEGPTEIEAPANLSSLEIIAFGDGWAVGFEGETPLGRSRVVTLLPSGDSGPRLSVSDTPVGGFDLATDGSHLVLTDEMDQLRFFLPDGTVVASHEIMGLNRVPGPIASSMGAVATVVPDSFDFNLGYTTAMDGVGATEPAPFGTGGDDFWIETTSDLVLAVRRTAEGVQLTPLLPDLRTRDGDTRTITSPMISAVRISAAESSTGSVAVLAAAAEARSLAVLAACGD